MAEAAEQVLEHTERPARASDDVIPSECDHRPSSGHQTRGACAIRLKGLGGCVKRPAVDLHREFAGRPSKVDTATPCSQCIQALHPEVRTPTLGSPHAESPAAQQRRHTTLGLGLRAGSGMRNRQLQRRGSSEPLSSRGQPTRQPIREPCVREPSSLEAAIEELDCCTGQLARSPLHLLPRIEDVQQRCFAISQQQSHSAHDGSIEGPAQHID